MTRSRRWLAGAIAIMSLGCEPQLARIDMQARTTPPGSVGLTEQGMTIATGLAVGFVAVALDESDSPMPPETTLEMASTDPTIAGVDPSLEAGTFVIYGVAPGSAEVTVGVDGEFYQSIPVVVTEPTGP